MGRTVLANRKLEKYVQTIAENKKFSYGIIIGQTSSLNKDYVIHLAKTSTEVYDLDKNESTKLNSSTNNATSSTSSSQVNNDIASSSTTTTITEETLETFDEQNLINHAISITKMIPGSFYVLGAFVITQQSVSKNVDTVNKFKNIIRELSQALDLNKYFCGHPPNCNQEILKGKLLLNYILSSQSFECKLYDGTGTNPTPVDWKFLDKPTVWHMFESSYELDEIFPIKEGNRYFNLENNFLFSLEHISSYIETSEIFIQNENVDENQSLENYIKEKLNKKETINSFKASILQSTSITHQECSSKISEYNGTIRYIGTISSRVWIHPKSSFKDIQQFIKNDILRSLAARIQIFCDGLTNPNTIHDKIVVNIPPKRIFFDIPDSGGIQFSEYLFNGENTQTVIEQAKEILDLNIIDDNIKMELEQLPDYEDTISLYTSQKPSTINGQNDSLIDKKYGGKKLMYYTGIAVALTILFISILLHFLWR